MRHHFLGDFGPAAPLNPGGGIIASPTTTKRSTSPFAIRLPKATQAIFDQIRAKSKQALPAAPAATLPTAPAPAFKLGMLGWGLLGLGGYMLLFRKKGKQNG